MLCQYTLLISPWTKCCFPDFFLTYWWISKFPDTYQNLLTFSYLFKDLKFLLTFSWPVGNLYRIYCLLSNMLTHRCLAQHNEFLNLPEHRKFHKFHSKSGLPSLNRYSLTGLMFVYQSQPPVSNKDHGLECNTSCNWTKALWDTLGKDKIRLHGTNDQFQIASLSSM